MRSTGAEWPPCLDCSSKTILMKVVMVLCFFHWFNPANIKKKNEQFCQSQMENILECLKTKHKMLSDWPGSLWVLVCDPIRNAPWAEKQRKAQVSEQLHLLALIETFKLSFSLKEEKNQATNQQKTPQTNPQQTRSASTIYFTQLLASQRNTWGCHCNFVPLHSEPKHI